MVIPLRQCCISHKKKLRSKLWRLVRVKQSESKYTCVLETDSQSSGVQGRSIHIYPTEKIIHAFFSPHKKKMAEHFLRYSFSRQEWELLSSKALECYTQSVKNLS